MVASKAGVQLPVTPLISVVGNGLESPSQIGSIGSKVVVFCGVTVISTLSIVASPHSSSMVTVYVVVVLGERVGFGIFTSLTPVLGLQV